MTTTRCCSRCRTPYAICADKACKCHNKLAEVIELRKER